MRVKRPLFSRDFTYPNHVQLLQGGKTYFDELFKLIQGASAVIHFQAYIFEEDETGLAVVEALTRAVQRGIKVYLLVDGYASRGLTRQFIKQLGESGILFRFFEPLFRGHNFYFGRRLHQKLVVVDARYALVGGLNVTNRYNDLPGQPAWLDFALLVEGPVAKELCVLAVKTWNNFTHTIPHGCNNLVLNWDSVITKGSKVRMRRNDWVAGKVQVTKTYIGMLQHATDRVTILCSYFIPGHVIRKSISKAIKRGVKIRVIIAGRSDVQVAKNAERFMYDWLLRHTVEIYEYEKNILHGKMAVSDGKFLTIGSYNLNDVSAYASIELNLDVEDEKIVLQVERLLDEIIEKDCTAITGEHHRLNNNLLRKFIYWCSFKTIRLLFFLTTFYFKKDKRLFRE